MQDGLEGGLRELLQATVYEQVAASYMLDRFLDVM